MNRVLNGIFVICAPRTARNHTTKTANEHLSVRFQPGGRCYTPDPSVYSSDANSGTPWIMWAGTPYEHLMIPVK